MPFWRMHEPPVGQPGLWLVIGLGNPGAQYAGTRHNAGAMVIQSMAERAGIRLKASKQRADVARCDVEGMPLLLAIPQTFMNESGNAASRLLTYYKIEGAHMVVVCDDLDLPFGTLRVRAEGSSGGQKGLDDVIRCVGTQSFPRVRVGIGRPAGNTIAHVLQPFATDERAALPRLIELASEAVIAVIRDGVPSAMNQFNRSWLDALA